MGQSPNVSIGPLISSGFRGQAHFFDNEKLQKVWEQLFAGIKPEVI
jgi:hypothetical protein